MFWRKKRKQGEPLADDFKCRCCGCGPPPAKDRFSYSNESGYRPGFCIRCDIGISDEKDRRIRFMRDTVGKLSGSDPYRGGGTVEEMWERAKELANTDPYRKKKYDRFIKL